jgi:hypothetical protein
LFIPLSQHINIRKGFFLVCIAILCLLIDSQVFAQDAEPELIVLKGHVLSADSLLPVPNAHIISKFNRWGTISHEDGQFIMYVSPFDSVLFTSIGFASHILFIDSTIMESPEDYNVLMIKDTITINEVVIKAYWDYETMKMMVATMEPIDLGAFYPDWADTELLYKNIQPAPIGGPIQGLYNVFNREARMRRKLLRNRKQYNKIMIQMGRPEDTIPAMPEHMQVSPY